jgi:hypothetical protein
MLRGLIDGLANHGWLVYMYAIHSLPHSVDVVTKSRYIEMLFYGTDYLAHRIIVLAIGSLKLLRKYAEWYPGGWEEGNGRSLRSEEHCALAYGRRNLILGDELLIV